MTLSQATMILFLLSRVCHLAQNSRSRRVLSSLLYLPSSLSTFLVHFTDSLFYLYEVLIYQVWRISYLEESK